MENRQDLAQLPQAPDRLVWCVPKSKSIAFQHKKPGRCQTLLMVEEQGSAGTHVGPDRDRATLGHIGPALATQRQAAAHPGATGGAAVRSPSQKIWLQGVRKAPAFPGQDRDCPICWTSPYLSPFCCLRAARGSPAPPHGCIFWP